MKTLSLLVFIALTFSNPDNTYRLFGDDVEHSVVKVACHGGFLNMENHTPDGIDLYCTFSFDAPSVAPSTEHTFDLWSTNPDWDSVRVKCVNGVTQFEQFSGVDVRVTCYPVVYYFPLILR